MFDPVTKKYSAPTAFSLTDAQITSLGLTVASAGYDYLVTPDLDGNGRPDMVIQGESDPLDSLVLLAVYNQLPNVATIPSNGILTMASGSISVANYNADGLKDLYVERFGNYLSGNYSIAYADIYGRFSGLNSIPLPLSNPPETPPTPQLAMAPGQNESSVIASDSIGSIAGQFRVDESGAATYSIPIVAPTGTAGVTPQISLNYSSQAGNGLVGKGWSIGGLSAITRCRQTLGQDGVAKPVTWSAEDRFCLDGQRLIVDTGYAYGGIGARYRTEIDSFARIISVGGSVGNPDQFKVIRKDGSLAYYGTHPVGNDSKLITGSGTLSWALSRFTDSVGNKIDFLYQTSGGHRISEIRYAYGSGSSANASIDFSYENRTDDISGYIAAYPLQTIQRLATISVKNGIDTVRRYELTYRDEIENLSGDPPQPSQLVNLKECVGTVCLPPTHFHWETAPVAVSTTPSTLYLSTQGDRDTVQYRPADVNGDGIIDLVWQEWDEHTNGSLDAQIWWYVLGSGSNNFSAPIQFYFDGADVSKVSAWEVIDYNADGRSDVIIYTGGVWKVFLSKPQGSDWRLSSAGLSTPLNENKVQFLDVNSDGLADAVYIANNKLYVRILQSGSELGRLKTPI